MRVRLPILSVLLAVTGCDPGSGVPEPGGPVLVGGAASDAVDVDAETEAFLASGAAFGVVVDPTTGDTLTLEDPRRSVNSGNYTLQSAQCLDCVGSCATLDRQLRFDLVAAGAAAAFDVQTVSTKNYAFDPANSDCAVDGNGFTAGAGGTCPNQAVGPGPGSVASLVVRGTVASCGPFSVQFDTTDGECPDHYLPLGQQVSALIGQRDRFTTSCNPNVGSEDQSYWFTAPTDGTFVFSTANSAMQNAVAVFDGCGGAELACANVATPPATEEDAVLALVAGQSVLVVVERTGGLPQTYSLEAIQP